MLVEEPVEEMTNVEGSKLVLRGVASTSFRYSCFGFRLLGARP